jgi:putative two-component system response regulator
MITAHTIGRLLIIDDQESNIRLLERILLRAGYSQFRSTTEAREAVSLFLEFNPDLIILDLHMPHTDGFAVLEQIRPHVPPDSYLPILVVTGDTTVTSRRRALSAGARDFLAKPYDSTEVLLRIRNLLEARFLHLALQAQNDSLEEKVRQRTRQLEEAQQEILERLALAAEFRDDSTRQHTQRVGMWSARLARKLGLPEAVADLVGRAAPLHDLGKVAVPDGILLKLDRLTADETRVMQTHTQIGAKILSGSNHPLLQLAEQIALTHHEHWDGSGYDPAMRGEAIPLVSRIVAVVDVFDALTHARPYKPAWPIEDAVAELERQSGRQFDPQVVSAFIELLEETGLLDCAVTVERGQRNGSHNAAGEFGGSVFRG